MMNQLFSFYLENTELYWGYVAEHIALSVISLLLAFLIAFPFGFLSYEKRQIKQAAILLSQGMRVIPSIGILFILIPIIGAGKIPALIALTLLGIPPILLNTIIGFEEVPNILLETGKGLGMSGKDLFFSVQFPLALRHLLNGIKIALIEIFASATLATYIGAGGLGTLIFTGLGLYRYDLILLGAGSITLIILASMILFDFLIMKSKRHLGKKALT